MVGVSTLVLVVRQSLENRPKSIVVQVIARNSDWFMALFAPVVIGRNNYFGIAFDSHLKTSTDIVVDKDRLGSLKVPIKQTLSILI